MYRQLEVWECMVFSREDGLVTANMLFLDVVVLLLK